MAGPHALCLVLSRNRWTRTHALDRFYLGQNFRLHGLPSEAFGNLYKVHYLSVFANRCCPLYATLSLSLSHRRACACVMWAAAGGFVGAATEVVISMDTSLLVHGAVHLPHPRPLLAMLVAETPRAGSLCGFPPAAATGIHHQATYSSCRLFSQGPYGAVVGLKALTIAICPSVH